MRNMTILTKKAFKISEDAIEIATTAKSISIETKKYCDDNIEKIKGLEYKTQNQDLKLEDHSSTIDQNLDELERKIEKRIHVIKEDIDKPENKDNQDVNDYRTLRIG